MRKKIVFIGLASVICLAVLGGGVFYFAHRHHTSNQPIRPVNTVDYGPPKKEDSAQVESAKDKAAQQDNKPGNVGGNTNGDNTTPSNLSVTITESSQSGNQLIIRALVNGTTSGTCQLTLSNNGQTVTRSAAISTQATYAICQGFNIPLSDLPSEGVWKISITATAQGVTSPAAETTRQVQK